RSCRQKRIVHGDALERRCVAAKLGEQTGPDVDDADARRRLGVANAERALRQVDVLAVERAKLTHARAREAQGRYDCTAWTDLRPVLLVAPVEVGGGRT